MKNKILSSILGAAVAVGLVFSPSSAPDAGAQYMDPRLVNGQDILVQGAGSTSTLYSPILIKYIGSSPAGGTVTVAAGGGITLKSGPVGTSVADTTTECPVSGALGGVIDVTNAACDTLGEVVDAINGSANWRAAIQDGLRSDSANDTLFTLAETSASTEKGLALKGDTTVSLNVTFLLAPVRDDIRQYLNENTNTKPLTENPFADSQYAFWRATWTSSGTGADTFDVIFSKPVNRTCTVLASSISCSASETTTQYSEPGGTTGVNKNFDFTRFGLQSPPGRRVLIRGRYATTHTAVTLFSGAARALSFKPLGR